MLISSIEQLIMRDNMHSKQIGLLMGIGLTKLQARIYIILLQDSGLTGYKIA